MSVTAVRNGVGGEAMGSQTVAPINKAVGETLSDLRQSQCSAISLPPNDYPLWDSIRDGIVDSGKLSRLQLEGVRYACRKHQEVLPSGQRAGFFIGDGAGVGKGRQIAGAPHQHHDAVPPA